ncbi:GSU2403 family nucleotidyltransferase fold protein, partial [Pseudoroseomonas wenyumeiae]
MPTSVRCWCEHCKRAGASPLPGAIGRALSAMADAGAFRLRAVLVGTVAFHAYAAMLGIKLAKRASPRKMWTWRSSVR